MFDVNHHFANLPQSYQPHSPAGLAQKVGEGGAGALRPCRGVATLVVLFCVAVLFGVPEKVLAQSEEDREARASLPLAEILELYRERDAALEKAKKSNQPVQPPVDAVLDRVELRGRLLDEALEIHALVRVTALAEGRWVKLPLLQLGPGTQLGELPKNIPGAALTIEDGQLMAMLKKQPDQPMSLSFELSWLERARVDGETRRARLQPSRATLQSLVVDVDESLFRLSGDVQRQTDGFRIFPDADGFELGWRRLRPQTTRKVESRPPVEPLVTSAHLSTVATLEGEVHHRLRYDLRFEGRREMAVELPPGTRLERVYVHQRSVPFEVEGGVLNLELEPARAGDRLGQVELSLRPEPAAYHLSGELLFTLPQTSWPVNHFYARLHLPSVFDYRWSGGSLAPTETAPLTAFSETLPSPGDELIFHQPLVHGSQPTVRVAYDIDLEGQIFEGR